MEALTVILFSTLIITVLAYFFLKKAQSKVISEYGHFITFSTPPDLDKANVELYYKFIENTYNKINDSVSYTGLYRAISFGMLAFCAALNLLILCSAAFKIAFVDELNFENIITFFSLGGSTFGGYIFYKFYQYFQKIHRESLKDLDKMTKTIISNFKELN